MSNGGLEVTMDGATVADGGMVIQNSGTAKATLEVNLHEISATQCGLGLITK